MSALTDMQRQLMPKHFPECPICQQVSACVHPNCRCAICDECTDQDVPFGKRGVRMNYVCNILPGDEEARGSEDLYQCPKCKAVKTK